MKYSQYYLYFLCLLPTFIQAQGGLLISSGTKVVVNGNPQIVINDGDFTNNGDFSAGNSTVQLTGDAATEHSTIGGAAITLFNNLTIAKTTNNTRLDFDIQMNGDLQMDGGLLILNNSDIELGGIILGETEATRVTGPDGGAIIKTVTLNMPTAENPGNLGLEITSASNLGSTTIRRSHIQQVNESGKSIFRYFQISPANNSNLAATLRMHYFNAELDGLVENSLLLWQYHNSAWSSLGADSNDAGQNWVETSGVAALHNLTLAMDMNPPLPIELLDFQAVVNENKQVDLYWTTSSEIDNDFFTIERSKDGTQFYPVAEIDGAGNSFQPLTYQTIDKNPFTGTSYYRLKQTDFDGTFTYSDIRAVHLQLDQSFSVFPNPMNEILHVVGNGSISGKASIELVDALGDIKYSRQLDMSKQVNSLQIPEVAGLMAGTYFLIIRMADGTYTYKLMKMSE